MKKLVIALVVIAILAVAGYVLFLKPVPKVFTPESAEKMALSSCSKDVQDLALLLQAIESDETKCEKLPSDIFKYYCFAWFEKDFCINLDIENEISCIAILSRKPESCINSLCHGILKNEAGCTDPACVAIARRDKARLSDPGVCQADVQKAVERVSCTDNAKSVAEFDACRSAQ